ncbi:MAG: hypothetical protein GXO58_10425 [Thermodesulfobacteria bacterium]|nr:hypothetical protein [Thermodesulfobacteriota bacterium]
MQLRRFRAKSISDALEKVKVELGDDAVILSTKNRSERDKKTGKRINYVEIVAAVDKDVDRLCRPFEPQREEVAGKKADVGPGQEDLFKEMAQLKAQVARLVQVVEGLSQREHEGERATARQGDGSQGLHETVASCLGLDRKSEAIVRNVLSRLSEGEKGWTKVIPALRAFITKGLRQGPIAEELGTRCWWAFVGPTGVGKTTTLAKIAARLKFLCKKEGALICVDGYRMGAAEQLEKYANLMDIPFYTAKTNKELVRLFGIHKDKDFIFVDTTGRNPFTSSHKTELERLFDSVPGLMAQVMLSATCKREDLMGAISFYKQFPIAGWTLTKVDETRSLAASVFPLIEADLPLSYVTNGQRVPEDISSASGKEIAELTLEPLRGLGRLLDVPRCNAKEKETVVPESL